jgi:hypothetical protein
MPSDLDSLQQTLSTLAAVMGEYIRLREGGEENAETLKIGPGGGPPHFWGER